MIRDNDLGLEELILKHSSDEKDTDLMENLSLYMGPQDNFEEIKYIFVEIPKNPLVNPSLGQKFISSSSQVLYDSTFPYLEIFRVEPSPSKTNHDSYFLAIEEPLSIFSDPVELKFFRPAGITLHHQLVSFTRILVHGPKIYSVSIFWVLLNTACEPLF